jgi:Fe-S oxidoreductase
VDAKPASDWLVKPKKIIRGKPGGPVISFGGLYEVTPLEEFYTGAMFEGATFIMGGDYCCRYTETHVGRSSAPIKFLPTLVDNLAKAAKELGVNEIIFTHDACYNVLTTLATEYRIEVPFKPVHILKYIRDWLRDHKDRIKKKQNMKIAYQGGCTTRDAALGIGEEIWSDWLTDIFDLIGAELVEEKRKYTDIDRLCCGCAIFLTQHDRAMEIQRMNIQDALNAGAEKYVFFCPACTAILRGTCNKMGLEPYYITQIVKLALGEDLGPVGGAAMGYPIK